MKSTLIYESLRQTGPQICLSGSGRARLLWVTIEKYNSEGVKTGWGVVCVGGREWSGGWQQTETGVKEIRWRRARKAGPREGQDWRGRGNSLHSQKPLKFDSPTLWINQPIIPLSLSFKFVASTARRPPPPCLRRSPSLQHSLGRIVNSTTRLVHLVGPRGQYFFLFTCSVSVCLSLLNGCRDRRSSSLFFHFFFF